MSGERRDVSITLVAFGVPALLFVAWVAALFLTPRTPQFSKPEKLRVAEALRRNYGLLEVSWVDADDFVEVRETVAPPRERSVSALQGLSSVEVGEARDLGEGEPPVLSENSDAPESWSDER